MLKMLYLEISKPLIEEISCHTSLLLQLMALSAFYNLQLKSVIKIKKLCFMNYIKLYACTYVCINYMYELYTIHTFMSVIF